MLLNVLPGVRHVRTPLITGYLILATLWVALGSDRLVPRRGGDNLENSIAVALDSLPAAAALAGLSFAAYLLGSIATISRWPLNQMSPVTGQPRFRAFGAPSSPLGDYGYDHFEVAKWAEDLRTWSWALAREFADRFTLGQILDSTAPGYFKAAVDRRVYEDLEDEYGEFRERFEFAGRSADESDRAEQLAELRTEMQEFVSRVEADVTPPFMEEGDEITYNYDSDWWMSEHHRDARITAVTLNHALLEEADAELATATARLRVESPILYDDHDRKRSEAEMRYSIAGPLTTLLVSAGATSSWWVLVGLALPAILVRQGFLIERDSTVDLLAAIRYGATTSPTEQGLKAIGDRAY